VSASADSSNAAEVAQAAIMQSQQKKLKHGTPSSVLSSAAVLHRPAQPAMAVATVPEYTQYRELMSHRCYIHKSSTTDNKCHVFWTWIIPC